MIDRGIVRAFFFALQHRSCLLTIIRLPSIICLLPTHKVTESKRAWKLYFCHAEF